MVGNRHNHELGNPSDDCSYERQPDRRRHPQGGYDIATPLYLCRLRDDFGASDTATTLTACSEIVKVTAPGCPDARRARNLLRRCDQRGPECPVQTDQPASRRSAGDERDHSRQRRRCEFAQKWEHVATPPTQCQQAVTAAQNAAELGNLGVLGRLWRVVAHFDDGSNTSRTTAITACSTMSQIANVPGATAGTYVNDPTKFFPTTRTAANRLPTRISQR